MRRSILVTFFMSILVNIGMWFERFVIIVYILVSRLPAIKLEPVLFAHHLGSWFLHRHLRIVLYLLLPVQQILPGNRYRGD